MANDDPLQAAQTGRHYSVGTGAPYQAASEGMPPPPEFREHAWPRCVDPELLALEPERVVLFHELPSLSTAGRAEGLMTGFTTGRAFQVVAQVKEQIARQARGFFTLAEAAQILANANAGCDVRDLIQRMTTAIVKGRRLPRDPGSKLPVLEETDRFIFLWVATPEDIDAWLAEEGAPYRFPKTPEAAEPVPTTHEAPPPKDFSAFATRTQLIAAFGAFTDMRIAWFDNLKDTPALLTARKVRGVGARGSTKEPLFCPWQVMVWLMSEKRKKGRKFHSENTPWELLEKHFPAAYEAHLRDDPREYRPG